MSEITVIGAGLAGLVAARELVLQGHTVRVLEATTVVGGRWASAEIGGRRVDVGDLLLDDTDGVMSTLLGRIGNAPVLITARPRRWWLFTPSGLHRLPAVHWFGVPATPLAADSVAITGRRAAWRGMLDALLPGPRGAGATTLEELVRTRMGAGIAERLVAPVVEAQFGRPVERVQVADVPGLRHRMLQQNSLARAVTSLRLDHPENSELMTIEGGPSRLIDALVAELARFGVPIELETMVDEVTDDGIVIDGVVHPGTFVLTAPTTGADAESPTAVTIVLDAQIVPHGARDAGVLAERGRPDGVRRVIDLSALWPGLVGDGGGSTVVRVEGSAAMTLEGAVQAVGEFWSVPRMESAVLGKHAFSGVPSPASASVTSADHPACIVAVVGDHASGPGVARMIAATIDAVSMLSPAQPPSLSHDGEAEV